MVAGVHNSYSSLPLSSRLVSLSLSSSSGKKLLGAGKTTSDCIVGNIAAVRSITHKSDQPVISGGVNILNLANSFIDSMQDDLQNLYSLASQAQNQDLLAEDLAALNQIFQATLRAINTTAANAKSGATALLDGTAAALAINFPSGDSFTISLKNLQNAATPLGQASPGDPQAPVQDTVGNVLTAITPGAWEDVIDLINTNCGNTSALSIVSTKIIEAFDQAQTAVGGGGAPAQVIARDALVDTLRATNWVGLGLGAAAAATITTLMNNAAFLNKDDVSTITVNLSQFFGDVSDINNCLLNNIVDGVLDALPAADVVLLGDYVDLNILTAGNAALSQDRVRKAIGYFETQQTAILGQIKQLQAISYATLTKSSMESSIADNARNADIDNVSSQLSEMIGMLQVSQLSRSSLYQALYQNRDVAWRNIGM